MDILTIINRSLNIKVWIKLALQRKSIALGFIDQAVSSLTTLLLLVSAAQWLDVTGVGRFAIGMATIAPCVSVIRALCGETLIVKVTSLPDRFKQPRNIFLESEKMLGLALLLALAAAGLILGISVFWSGARDVLIASAIAVTGVVLQDSIRHYLLTARRSLLLLSGDLFVLVFAVGGIYYLGAIGQKPTSMIILWGAVSLIAAIVVMTIDGAKPRVFDSYAWLRNNWGNSSAFVMEAVMGAIVGYLVVVILAVFTSDSEVAAYRTVVSVFGITSLVINFLRTAVLRELTPKRMHIRKLIIQKCLQMTALVFATALFTLLGVRLLPGNVGSVLLGDSWQLVVGLAGIAALNRFVAGLSIAPLIVLRVQGISWPATRIRIGATFVALALSPFAAYIAGAAGALAADSIFYLIVTVFLLRLALKTAAKVNRPLPSSSSSAKEKSK